MKELEGGEKIRVLLGPSSVLAILMCFYWMKPTNHLDLKIDSMAGRLSRPVSEYRDCCLTRPTLSQSGLHPRLPISTLARSPSMLVNYDFWYEASQLALHQKQEEKPQSQRQSRRVEILYSTVFRPMHRKPSRPLHGRSCWKKLDHRRYARVPHADILSWCLKPETRLWRHHS